MPTMLNTMEIIISQRANEDGVKSNNIVPKIKEIMPIIKRILPTDFMFKFFRLFKIKYPLCSKFSAIFNHYYKYNDTIIC